MKIFDENSQFQEKTEQEVIEQVKKYDETLLTYKNGRFKNTISMIPEINDDNKTFLDYGCGWGLYSEYISKKGYQVTAVDLLETEIEIAKLVRKNVKNIEFKNIPITELPSDIYDGVLSTQVIEHVHNVGTYLSEINRVLKKNGVLIISLPNIITLQSFLANFFLNLNKLKDINKNMLKNYNKLFHINAWDPIHFTILCSSLGFEIEEYRPADCIHFQSKFKFLPSFLNIKLRYFINLSNTMIFKFKKVKNIKIEIND